MSSIHRDIQALVNRIAEKATAGCNLRSLIYNEVRDFVEPLYDRISELIDDADGG